jgi:hypothetical protein
MVEHGGAEVKEKYIKPAMMIERFALSSTIAKTCTDYVDPESLIGANSVPVCKWDFGAGMLIFASETNCTMDYNEIDSIICYNNPGEGQYIFSS